MPFQTASRSLFAKRRHGPEDTLWWRTAMKQMPTARDSISHQEVRHHRDVHSRRRWLSISPQSCRQCSDGSATPRRDSTWSLQSVTRQYGKHPQAVTHHTERMWVRHGTDHENNVAICSYPFLTQEHCLREKQRGSRLFRCGKKYVIQQKKRSARMTRPRGEGQKNCMSSFGKGANTLFDVA